MKHIETGQNDRISKRIRPRIVHLLPCSLWATLIVVLWRLHVHPGISWVDRGKFSLHVFSALPFSPLSWSFTQSSVYPDDGTIGGCVEDIVHDLQFVEEASLIGLQLIRAKRTHLCSLWLRLPTVGKQHYWAPQLRALVINKTSTSKIGKLTIIGRKVTTYIFLIRMFFWFFAICLL